MAIAGATRLRCLDTFALPLDGNFKYGCDVSSHITANAYKYTNDADAPTMFTAHASPLQ